MFFSIQPEFTPTEKPYLVKKTIITGEYEKLNSSIVIAPTRELAELYGCYVESHNTDSLEWDENTVTDGFGEFVYYAKAIEMPLADYHVLAKYNFVSRFRASELLGAGNFAKVHLQNTNFASPFPGSNILSNDLLKHFEGVEIG
ncbi:hypothetical protein TUMSATVNIG1_61090 (plasmid) [Vibrio nigripulchritudo]|uniref:hypothetical protein n=1 Tax=Vibrio nigripulchritudo TaxID=28173 RepID=UPI00190A7954|nr:hypothetical protein [Vibrio nigripulchritudo]BCL74125.1 hypothetical protein VNTUMSATTG_60620 [Vibrio nigripulchritudo]BDU35500.1 hypothetical protein TUMSATVNIG1_61090 [Vibrio nigripulchritudo]